MLAKKGFALVEFTVVLGFFFIFIAVFLFFLNPIERAKQKHDERLNSDAQAVLSSLSNFYISQGRMPWAPRVNFQESSPALNWKPLRAFELGICADDLCREPGELVKGGFLANDFLGKDSVLGRNGIIYVGKAVGVKSLIYACFIPSSSVTRSKTGGLFRINPEQDFPRAGTLSTCPSVVTWGEDDVCYQCVTK